MVSLHAALKAEHAVGTYGNSILLRCVILNFLAVYLSVVLWYTSDQLEDTYTSPEGLQMTVSSPFPSWFMRIHYWSGVLLVFLTVLQKHITLWIQSPRSKTTASLRKTHKYLGYFIILLAGFMSFGGFSLRSHSTFEGFQFAMVLFVAPWVAFIVIVPLSGYFCWGLTHVIAGEALFKACVAVPLARSLGVAFQKFTNLSMGDGYYLGIIVGSIIIGLWAIYDLILFVGRLRG